MGLLNGYVTKVNHVSSVALHSVIVMPEYNFVFWQVGLFCSVLDSQISDIIIQFQSLLEAKSSYYKSIVRLHLQLLTGKNLYLRIPARVMVCVHVVRAESPSRM